MTAHDEAWFNAVYNAHASAVARFLARRAPASDVEDLAAEVFTTCWRRRDDVPVDSELPWLYKTAGFVLANYRRKMQAIPASDAVSLLEKVDADTPEDAALLSDQLREILAKLPARDVEILLLNAWEGLTGDALAEVLGISRGGADAALSRARARLKQALA